MPQDRMAEKSTQKQKMSFCSQNFDGGDFETKKVSL